MRVVFMTTGRQLVRLVSKRFFLVMVLFRGKRIRIQWTRAQVRASPQTLALAGASLLAPCALVAFTLTCWNIAADLRWTSGFFVSRGLFSHWQSWLAASLVLLLLSRALAQSVNETD